MNGVFLDTSGLFAALVANDELHERAAPVLERLLEEPVDLYCNSYVFLETLALLQARVGLQAARRVERELRPLVRVVWVEERLHERAFQRFELRDRSGLSLVDCSSFVTMEDVRLRHVFTYDDDFSEEGFILLTDAAELGRELET